jgi:hypothetical protein
MSPAVKARSRVVRRKIQQVIHDMRAYFCGSAGGFDAFLQAAMVKVSDGSGSSGQQLTAASQPSLAAARAPSSPATALLLPCRRRSGG